jgi:hypothetical protein
LQKNCHGRTGRGLGRTKKKEKGKRGKKEGKGKRGKKREEKYIKKREKK